jgi:hypothetical protein
MKGLNVRKIAAFAGATLLGLSAVAVAELVYGNTQLVDQNGQPTVKVYVGSKAAASDGVAAANIAAKIANEAYKGTTLTAKLSGTPTCTVGTGTSGTGTCQVVESSKKVTLAVTVPGQVAGKYNFYTLITDSLDKTPENRVYAGPDDTYPATLTSNDVGTTLSPLRGVSGVSTDKAQNLYKIGGASFSGFADYSVVDNKATSGGTYTEEQAFWVGTSAKGVKFSETEHNVVVDKYAALVYSVRFTGNDYGIPVCTGDLNSSQSDNWASCDKTSNDRTEKHRVKIKFLGSEYIISELTPTTTSINTSTSAATGGQIKLAKESKYGVISVGDVIDLGAYKLKLLDISQAKGADKDYPAIFDILDSNGNVVEHAQVGTASTQTVSLGGGKTLKIRVYQTAPGLTFQSKWAEVAVYADEVTLKDGQRYNLISTDHPDKDFKVSLIWKNRDRDSGSSNESDSLREIVVYQVDNFNKVKPGDSVSFLKKDPVFKLSYNGLDLQEADYEQLKFEAAKETLKVAGTGPGIESACSNSTNNTLDYTAKLVKIYTPDGKKLGGGSGNALGNYLFSELYFDPIGTNSTGGLSGTQNNTSVVSTYKPKLFVKRDGVDCYNYVDINYVAQNYSGALSANTIKFEIAGDNSAAYGALYFNNSSVNGFGDVSVFVREDAGKLNITSNNLVYYGFPVNVSGTEEAPRFKSSTSSTSNIYYRGLFDTVFSSKDLSFITERGSVVDEVSTTGVSVKVAKKVGRASFTFANADSASTSDTQEYVLGVGESKVFGGVTVLVKAIDAVGGSCSVTGPGGQPACTVDPESVKPVISPDNKDSVTAITPVPVSKLVYLDTDAQDAGAAIIVGGPEVNELAKSLLTGQNAIDFTKDRVVVKEFANGKILVAGYSAQDTLQAADKFLSELKKQ